MATPYIGEIRITGFNFAPIDWAFCNGQLLSIASYEALYNLIGTTYGGDGVQTFGLPNLQSRVPIHWGTGPGLSTYVIGQQAGTETVTLGIQQIPQHSHLVNVSSSVGTTGSPSNATYGQTNNGSGAAGYNDFVAAAPNSVLANNAVANAGGSQPHSNIQPSLCVNFIIALYGVYPSQS